MPLGSAPTSKIDIDFTRAQGVNSSGQIIFQPNRIKIGTTILSSYPVVVEVKEGIGSVDLVRLPVGRYHVREMIDGRTPYEFSFELPVSAADVIQYEDIAQVGPMPAYFTYAKSVNGVLPNPTTGNIVIEVGSSPDATDSVKGILRLTGDLGGTAASPAFSAARIAEINEKYVKPGGGIPSTDMTTVVQNVLVAAATAVQPAALSAVIDMIPTDKSDIGLGNVDNTSDVDKPVSTAGGVAIAARSLPDRVVRIVDVSRNDPDDGPTSSYMIPNTGDAWDLLSGPPEYTIPAAIGDDIEVSYGYLLKEHSAGVSVDLAVVTGGTPTAQRYLSSGSSTPTFGGSAGDYPNGEGYQGCSGVLGFTAEAGDIDGGNVRFRFVAKSTTDLGRLLAKVNYPLRISIRNTRLSGL